MENEVIIMKRFLKIFILILLAALPAYKAYALFFSVPEVVPVSAEEDGVQALRALEEEDISEVQRKIDVIKEKNARVEAERLLRDKRKQGTDNVLKQLADGDITFNGIFQDTLIVGDSLMKGLSAYNILSEDIVIGQVSATLYHLQENIQNIIYADPDIVIMHYGENHIGSASEASVKAFTDFYKKNISELKKGLPDTVFYVSGIFLPSPEVKNKPAFLDNIPLYNEALKKMCEETGVIFLDNSQVLPGDCSYYGSDGIHVQPAFYREVWLPFVIYELGL